MCALTGEAARSERTAVQPFGSGLKDLAGRGVFGPGSLAQVASEARTLGARILIIFWSPGSEALGVVSAQLGDDLAWRIPGVVQHVPVEIAVVVSIGGDSATGLPRRLRDTPDCRSLPSRPRTRAAR